MPQTLRQENFDELVERVDIVPPSLALVMAAYESGWGTSRFSTEASALFGQWIWGGGLRPKKARASLGNYGIAQFSSPLESARAYALNLNTHQAYRAFRQQRAVLRRTHKPLSGLALTSTMINYSELGATYVKTLQALIRTNYLPDKYNAYLRNERVIHLIPISQSNTP